MPTFTVEVGVRDSAGAWTPRSHRYPINATDIEDAKLQADELLESGQFEGCEDVNAVKVAGPEEKRFAWRALNAPAGWENGNA